MKQLKMYYKSSCPFCNKVIAFLQSNGIDLPELKDVTDPSVRDELIQLGGKGQVPCLIIDQQPLYESDDIIQWFKDNVL